MRAFLGRLDRYVLWKAAWVTAMVSVLMVIITLSVDFLINIGSYLHVHAAHPGLIVLELYWYRLPQLANLALPIGMVLSALVVCGPMLKRGEFVALNASGIAPARAALMLPLVALLVGGMDAVIADRVTPGATIETVRLDDLMRNSNPVGKVWRVEQTRASWFCAGAGGLVRDQPSVERVVVACHAGLLTADHMAWRDHRWQLEGHLTVFLVHDGICELKRPATWPLEGPWALPYTPHELYAHLLPRDTMSTAELLATGESSDISYAYSRWLRLVIPLLAVLAALPTFVRFLHKDNLILGVVRALVAAAVPVVVVVVGALTGERAHSALVIPTGVLVALVPTAVRYRRWRL